MIWSSLLSAGAFGLAAQAFLVIPEASSLSDIDHYKDAPAAPASPPTEISLTLDCSNCPYALESQRNNIHEWTSDVKSDLELVFANKGNSLTVNDVPFIPPQNPLRSAPLTVSQKKKDGETSTMEGFHGKLGLSYSVEYTEKKFEDHSLVTIVTSFLGLDDQMIRVDNVNLQVIKGSDGQLTFHSIAIVPDSPDAPDAKCENILCRVFTKIMTGIAKAKASAKGAAHKVKCVCLKCIKTLTGVKHIHDPARHHGGKAVPHRRPDGTMELPSHVQFKPAGHHGSHGFPHHHRHGGFWARTADVLRVAVKVVFVPILIGVAFGMAASAIGMLVGQAIVFLWLKLRRSPENGAYERVESDEKEAPPAYQDIQSAGAEAVNEKDVEAKA